MNTLEAEPLVLASASEIRRKLLAAAGVDVLVVPAHVDEVALRESGRRDGLTTDAMTELLSEIKARRVAAKHPGALVCGVDQILDLDGTWLDKVDHVDGARARLLALRGRSHTLVTSLVVVKDDQRVWHVTDRATLTVRAFSDDFLETYLARAGSALTASVGCYAFEGVGVHLFSAVSGDYYTILGLPLVPFLGFLRQRGGLLS